MLLFSKVSFREEAKRMQRKPFRKHTFENKWDAIHGIYRKAIIEMPDRIWWSRQL